MIIKNGIVLSRDGKFRPANLYTCGPVIVDRAEQGEADGIVLDASNAYVIPGLVDIHVHGAMGTDMGDALPGSIKKLAEYEASEGVTSICPATMTAPREQLLAEAKALREYCELPYKERRNGASVLGINMEGPFLSEAKKGSHEKKYLVKPDMSLVNEMQEASGGRIRLVDIAPELPGAVEFIRGLDHSITPSIAHTEADYETARAAMEAGAHHVTHLFNAMTPFAHRAPGVAGAAVDDPLCFAELIADGRHVHPSVVRAAFRMLGADRICIISDSMRAVGLQNGEYEFGGHKVYVNGRDALLADGTIAASASNMMQMLKVLIKEMNIDPAEAVKACSVNPARSVGADDKVGSLEPMKYADVVILDCKTLRVRKVILKGNILKA